MNQNIKSIYVRRLIMGHSLSRSSQDLCGPIIITATMMNLANNFMLYRTTFKLGPVELRARW